MWNDMEFSLGNICVVRSVYKQCHSMKTGETVFLLWKLVQLASMNREAKPVSEEQKEEGEDIKKIKKVSCIFVEFWKYFFGIFRRCSERWYGWFCQEMFIIWLSSCFSPYAKLQMQISCWTVRYFPVLKSPVQCGFYSRPVSFGERNLRADIIKI